MAWNSPKVSQTLMGFGIGELNSLYPKYFWRPNTKKGECFKVMLMRTKREKKLFLLQNYDHYFFVSNLLSDSQIQKSSECYKVDHETMKLMISCLEKTGKPVALEGFLCTWAIFVFFCWNLQRRNIRVPDWSLNCSWNGCSSWTVSPKL